MVRLFVRHNVNDYAAWRKGYDAFEPARIKLGAQGHAVYREVDDGNDVTVWHDFNSLEAAKAFANDRTRHTQSQLRHTQFELGTTATVRVAQMVSV